jgi:undecaprenyl-diphosphatase
MDILDSVILGILQGITEFLPISSSGHLVLGEHFLGLNVDMLKSFDVVVHVGTLLAILVYFWKDVWGMLKAFGRFFVGKFEGPYAKLILFIVIGTVPAVVVGLFGEEWIDLTFRNVRSVGMWMMIIGILFVLGEYAYKRNKGREMKWFKAVIIGCAQAFALIPGVSRSGSTIVAGLFQGIERSEAARFSFLLGIPAIAGAGLLTAIKIPGNGGFGVEWVPLVVGFLASFIFGLLSVAFLMRFLKKHSLIIFAVYLIALGFSVF